tara:strand:+ start:486 stop:1418 length:933 start_codon:yes stop_codon:yes gene_type:complete
MPHTPGHRYTQFQPGQGQAGVQTEETSMVGSDQGWNAAAPGAPRHIAQDATEQAWWDQLGMTDFGSGINTNPGALGPGWGGEMETDYGGQSPFGPGGNFGGGGPWENWWDMPWAQNAAAAGVDLSGFGDWWSQNWENWGGPFITEDPNSLINMYWVDPTMLYNVNNPSWSEGQGHWWDDMMAQFGGYSPLSPWGGDVVQGWNPMTGTYHGEQQWYDPTDIPSMANFGFQFDPWGGQNLGGASWGNFGNMGGQPGGTPPPTPGGAPTPPPITQPINNNAISANNMPPSPSPTPNPFQNPYKRRQNNSIGGY